MHWCSCWTTYFSHSCFLIIIDDEPKTNKNQSRVPYFEVFSTYTQFIDLWSEDGKYQCLYVLLEKSCKTYRWLINSVTPKSCKTMGSLYMIFVDWSSWDEIIFTPSFWEVSRGSVDEGWGIELRQRETGESDEEKVMSTINAYILKYPWNRGDGCCYPRIITNSIPIAIFTTFLQRCNFTCCDFTCCDFTCCMNRKVKLFETKPKKSGDRKMVECTTT